MGQTVAGGAPAEMVKKIESGIQAREKVAKVLGIKRQTGAVKKVS